MGSLKSEMAKLKEVFNHEFAEVKADLTAIKRDLTEIKGTQYESSTKDYASAIFGRIMRRGHDARNEVGLLLEEAEENGLITEHDHDLVLALDLLWGGKQKGTKADMVLAVEVSWCHGELRRPIFNGRLSEG
ncbi:hypothetical protein QUF64_05145 [Anaerolineales bacterium HSG6]|nr:hypothetical protein [Anaerolineales bacterium HSG6]